MAVATLLTSIENMETAPTFTSYGGGQGATVNTDIFIQGSQSGGRRADNVTDSGFGATFTAVDLSAAGQHVRVWLFVTQWAAVTQVQMRLSSGADDDHEFPTAEYPPLGGFVPVWIDVSRAPEVGGTANEASISEIGVLLDIGDVGGNAQNLIIDAISHGTSGLRWTGTAGDFADFRTFENTNVEGVLITLLGKDFCFARLEIGSATATTFTDSDFSVVFPSQALVASTFMGVTIDLQNASTSVSLTDGSIESSAPAAATTRPDFVVTGTAGTLTATGLSVIGARTVTLTSGVAWTGGTIDTVNMTQGSADVDGVTIRTRSASGVPCLTDPDFTLLTNTTFVQAGAGPALEIDTTGTYDLTTTTFEGYNAANGQTDSAIDITETLWTVTLQYAGATPPTYRTAGATVILQQTNQLEITGLINPSEVRVYNAGTTTEVAGQENVTTGTFTAQIDAATYPTVDISIISLGYLNRRLTSFSMATDRSIPASQTIDRQYLNP